MRVSDLQYRVYIYRVRYISTSQRADNNQKADRQRSVATKAKRRFEAGEGRLLLPRLPPSLRQRLLAAGQQRCATATATTYNYFSSKHCDPKNKTRQKKIKKMAHSFALCCGQSDYLAVLKKKIWYKMENGKKKKKKSQV